MLSHFPADFPGDSFAGNPFPPFEPGSLPWEHHEPDLAFHPTYTDEPIVPTPHPSPELVPYRSESSNPAPNHGPRETIRSMNKTSNLGPNRRNSKKLKSSGSDETSSLGPKIDDRKLKRMISNRDSARRSRMRKQKHLENLRDQVNRREVVNRELKNRIRLVVGQTQLFCAENECLLSEAVVLRRRLGDIRQVLLARLLLNPPHINNQGLYPIHSLIT